MSGRVLAMRGAPLARARLHHSGTGTVRVLVVGDRAQVLAAGGPGSPAQRIVDRVWLTTRRGVDLDVLTDLAPVLDAVIGAFDAWRLWRFDGVVLVQGADAGDRRRVGLLQRVHDLLQADADRRTSLVLVTTVLAGHRGPTEEEQRLLRRVERLGAGRLQLVEVPLRADPEERVRDLASTISARVVEVLARRDGPVRHAEDDESARQEALDDLGVVGRPPEPRLDDLVRLACTAFGAESAEINFIDRDRQWKMAVAGAERGENPRAHSFCSETITRPEPLVVGDARLHPVLRASPLVRGPHPIRFYAAHPIESLDGYRIGSFCVYDSEPRDVRGLDLAVLRDLALLAQAELVADDTAPAGAADRLQAR